MIIADAHCDVLNRICDENEELYSNTGSFSVEKIQKYDGFIQFFACFISPRFYSDPHSRLKLLINKFDEEAEKNTSTIMKCRSFSDMEDALKAGKCAAFLTSEGGEWIRGTEDIEFAYNKGIRVIGLTWDYWNRFASGAGDTYDKGLSDAGKEIIRKMNSLGICLDVSHLSDKAFHEASKMTTLPLLATHSNSRSVYGHKRNLTDEQLKIIAGSGGFAGVNMYKNHLGNKNVTAETVAGHIKHMADTAGEDFIGFGCDFDGMESMPDGIKGANDTDKILNFLSRNGEKTTFIDKIAHKNLQRVIKFF